MGTVFILTASFLDFNCAYWVESHICEMLSASAAPTPMLTQECTWERSHKSVRHPSVRPAKIVESRD